MNVQNVGTSANNFYGNSPAKISEAVPVFTIPRSTEQTTGTPAVRSADNPDPVSAMESMTGRISAPEPSYSVTDEEAEYFREKYGDTYNEEKARELYYELADKGIISENGAGYASDTLAVRRVEILGPDGRPVKNLADYISFPGCTPVKMRTRQIGGRVLINDISRTDKDSPYKNLWDSFKKTYDREIITWEDALKENIEFERYLKDRAEETDASTQWHFGSVLENLEKIKDVIFQIFGE